MFLEDTGSGSSFHWEAPLRARCLAKVFPTTAADLRQPSSGRRGGSHRCLLRAKRAQLTASPPRGLKAARNRSPGGSASSDGGRMRQPEVAPRPEHGGRPIPARGPERSPSLAAPVTRALPAPGCAQAGRRHRVPEHLQPRQALPRIPGFGHCLEGAGEPGWPTEGAGPRFCWVTSGNRGPVGPASS